MQGTNQLISFGGLLMYILLMLIFSKYPTKVVWRPVIWGVAMQFVLGLITLRTKVGFDAFNWLGNQIFLGYTDAGAKFVFGKKYTDHFFAFKVGWIMQITLQTSPVESLVAAGNIFVGMSELHAIMTAGFATIAGSVLGAYISFGTEKPQINAQQDTKMEKGEARNLLEAASQGASAAIPLVANIAVNLIAFLALLAFFNAVLSWLGNMFDYPQLSFEIICSYLFMPFSFMMGVDWEDSFIVGGLLGYKTFFNEFVAYEHLANLIKLRKKGGEMYINASLAPSRKRDIAGGAFRAMIAGTVACFMTACVAGILSENPCTTLLQSNFNANDNSTEIVACCLNLFTSGNSSAEVFPKSNSGLRSLHQCCQLLGPSKVNCSLVTPLS
ncbi:hypothetical protein E2320_017271 [Naja naja]|nr:hypothetical protein E2320_017271 [Naja naja]